MERKSKVISNKKKGVSIFVFTILMSMLMACSVNKNIEESDIDDTVSVIDRSEEELLENEENIDLGNNVTLFIDHENFKWELKHVRN